jgi:uncharacterized protein YjiS (DUF1127 family)
MTSFEMVTGNRQTKPFEKIVGWVLWAPLALFHRLLRAQRKYLAVQHLRELEREQLDDIGLDRSEIEAAVWGRGRYTKS